MSQAENSRNWRSGLSLAECNRYMLHHQIHCDVTFRVGEEGKLVRAHKYVLASRSPVFDAMLYGDLAESDVIRVPDIEPSTFDAFLRFLYCDDVNLTQETAITVLYAADKYGVEALVTKIKSYLNQEITEETVFNILENAKLFHLDDLVEKCKGFIESNPAPLFQYSSALELKKETLASVISLDSLAMDELEIYQFLVKWAEYQCAQVKMATTDQNVRTMMGDLVYFIRFHVLGLDFFVKNVCNREILDADEKLNLQQVMVGNLDKRNTNFKFEKRTSKVFPVLRGGSDDNNWQYCADTADCIEFRVNKPVRFHGYVMWGARSPPYTYTVQGKLFENRKEVAALPLQKIERNESSDKTFTICLPEPVLLSPAALYCTWVYLHGPDSWSGEDYNSPVTEHGVEFAFYTHDGLNNGSSSTFGQFPGFLCSL